jgi:hypothetical protein
MPYELVRACVSQVELDHTPAKTIKTIEPGLPFRRQAGRDGLQRRLRDFFEESLIPLFH